MALLECTVHERREADAIRRIQPDALILAPRNDVRSYEEILGHDPSNRAPIFVVGLDRPSKRPLRAASGLDRRSRIGDLVALPLNLFEEGFDLIGISIERLGSRVSLRDCGETRFQRL